MSFSLTRPSTTAKLLGACAASLVTSCGAGEPPPARPTNTPQETIAEPPPPFTSPARWSFHPPIPATAAATLLLEDGSCLITTDEGHRFRAESSTKDAPPVCKGKTTAAPDAGPERL